MWDAPFALGDAPLLTNHKADGRPVWGNHAKIHVRRRRNLMEANIDIMGDNRNTLVSR